MAVWPSIQGHSRHSRGVWRRGTLVVAATAAAALVATAARAQEATPPVSVTPATDALDVKLSGFLQIQGEFGRRGDVRYSSDSDRILMRRARLSALGHVRKDLEFKFELDLSGSLPEASGLRAQMTDGYAQWTYNEQLAVRGGQFKTPYGYEQLASDPRIYTIERTLGNDRLTLGRQVGVQASGEVLTKRLAYAVGAFNGTPSNQSGNDAEQFLAAGRLAAIPWQGELAGQKGRWAVGGGGFTEHNSHLSGQPVEFGFDATGGTVDDNIFVGDRTGFAVDSQARLGRAEVWAEFLNVRLKPDNDDPLDELEAAAWYVQGTFFVVQKRLQAVVKYDRYDPNAKADDDDTRTCTVGANALIKGDEFKVMLDYLIVTGPGIIGSDDKVLVRWQVMF